MTLRLDCAFCRIVAGDEPATVVRKWGLVWVIEPLNPVVEGHMLVLPTTHVRDATVQPAVTAMVMHRAAEISRLPCNIITSCGAEATQTVLHLHVHVIPRRVGDGLRLPWSVP